jgi:hypothetical protein
VLTWLAFCLGQDGAGSRSILRSGPRCGAGPGGQGQDGQPQEGGQLHLRGQARGVERWT